jgi:hypothetical protein
MQERMAKMVTHEGCISVRPLYYTRRARAQQTWLACGARSPESDYVWAIYAK